MDTSMSPASSLHPVSPCEIKREKVKFTIFHKERARTSLIFLRGKSSHKSEPERIKRISRNPCCSCTVPVDVLLNREEAGEKMAVRNSCRWWKRLSMSRESINISSDINTATYTARTKKKIRNFWFQRDTRNVQQNTFSDGDCAVYVIPPFLKKISETREFRSGI